MHVACVSPSFVLFAYVGENLVFLRNHHISLKSLMFSLNFLFIAIYFHAEYSPGHGRLPDLSKMEAKFLRLSTDLKLSTTQADAVSRCMRNEHHHKNLSFFKLISCFFQVPQRKSRCPRAPPAWAATATKRTAIAQTIILMQMKTALTLLPSPVNHSIIFTLNYTEMALQTI